MFPSIKEKRLIYKRTTHTENSKNSKNTGMGKKTEIQKNERLENYILGYLDTANPTVSEEYKTCLRCFNTLKSDPKIPHFQSEVQQAMDKCVTAVVIANDTDRTKAWGIALSALTMSISKAKEAISKSVIDKYCASDASLRTLLHSDQNIQLTNDEIIQWNDSYRTWKDITNAVTSSRFSTISELLAAGRDLPHVELDTIIRSVKKKKREREKEREGEKDKGIISTIEERIEGKAQATGVENEPLYDNMDYLLSDTQQASLKNLLQTYYSNLPKYRGELQHLREVVIYHQFRSGERFDRMIQRHFQKNLEKGNIQNPKLPENIKEEELAYLQKILNMINQSLPKESDPANIATVIRYRFDYLLLGRNYSSISPNLENTTGKDWDYVRKKICQNLAQEIYRYSPNFERKTSQLRGSDNGEYKKQLQRVVDLKEFAADSYIYLAKQK